MAMQLKPICVLHEGADIPEAIRFEIIKITLVTRRQIVFQSLFNKHGVQTIFPD